MQAILNCIILFVQDVDKIKSFYIDNLELELVDEINSEWVLLKAGTCELGLHKIGVEYLNPSNAPFKFDNNSKIVFEIDEDIFALHNKLVNKKLILKEVKTWDNYNYWIFDGEDPEGNIFQIRMKKQETT